MLRLLARVRGYGRAPGRRADSIWSATVEWFNALELSENAILIGFAVAIGAACSLGVVAFYGLIDLAYSAFFRWPEGFMRRTGFAIYRPVLTAAGFFLAWWIMRRLARGHAGMIVPDVQLAVARRGGTIPMRPVLARTAASAVTLGSGGSAGSEGPVAVLGSAIGSFLGQAFRFDASRVKILVAAGAAAGISAAFNAPLAGAFFALEEILGTLAVSAFPAVVVSSVTAAVISHSFFGNHPAISIPQEYGFDSTREILLFYPVLGVLTGLVSVLFIRVYFRGERVSKTLRLSPPLVPILAGLLVGLMVFGSRGLLVGFGHLAVRLDVFTSLAWYALAALAIGKIVATTLTLQFGGSGGVFTPALYVGAAVGAAFGAALQALFPAAGLSPEAYALVGMGAVVAAATHAPITGILIVFEMTNDYAIMLPLMLTTVIAYVVAKRIEPDSLYSGWLRRRGERIEHGADRDVLAGILVAEAYDTAPHVLEQSETLTEILTHLGRGEQTDYPVVGDDRELLGVVTVAELGRLARDYQDLGPVVVAADIAMPSETVSPGATLLEAVRRMGVRGGASIPVVDADTGQLLGLLTRAHVLALYHKRVTGSAGA